MQMKFHMYSKLLYWFIYSVAKLAAHQNCMNYFQINQSLAAFLFDLSHLYITID
jgi:hypothetical protein